METYNEFWDRLIKRGNTVEQSEIFIKRWGLDTGSEMIKLIDITKDTNGKTEVEYMQAVVNQQKVVCDKAKERIEYLKNTDEFTSEEKEELIKDTTETYESSLITYGQFSAQLEELKKKRTVTYTIKVVDKDEEEKIPVEEKKEEPVGEENEEKSMADVLAESFAEGFAEGIRKALSGESDDDEEEKPAYEGAVATAHSYLSSKYSGYSLKGITEQLEYEGYKKSEIKDALSELNPDWNEQAAKCAKSYLSSTHGGHSYKGIMEQMEYEGFTKEQAEYGINAFNADWNEQAVKSAEAYVRSSEFEYEELVEQLLDYEEFTYEQSIYAASKALNVEPKDIKAEGEYNSSKENKHGKDLTPSSDKKDMKVLIIAGVIIAIAVMMFL